MNESQGKLYLQELLEKLAFPILCLIFMVVYYISSKDMHEEALMYPNIIMIFLAILLIVYFVVIGIGWVKKVRAKKEPSTRPLWQNKLIPSLVLFLLSFAYLFIMPRLGYTVSTALFLLVSVSYLRMRWLYILPYVIIMTALVYVLFIYWLRVPLPEGILF